jgi:hypothetical protein
MEFATNSTESGLPSRLLTQIAESGAVTNGTKKRRKSGIKKAMPADSAA